MCRLWDPLSHIGYRPSKPPAYPHRVPLRVRHTPRSVSSNHIRVFARLSGSIATLTWYIWSDIGAERAPFETDETRVCVPVHYVNVVVRGP